MDKIFPDKLTAGDKIMVIAPSDSLYMMADEARKIAKNRFERLGLKVVFADNVEEVDEFDSSCIESRVADLHQAFSDTSVKAVFAAYGGYNSNQLLRYIDWDIIRNNPKMFVGFSDTTALQNAIFAKTGLVTYSGPTYSRFGQKRYFDYTLEYVQKCLFEEQEFQIFPSEYWSDDWWYTEQEKRELEKNEGWFAINSGEARGTILGGNLSTFNLLQGTEYFPDISDSVLFLEDDDESEIGIFDRDLQSLIHTPQFERVQGLVLGRFQKRSKVKTEHIKKMIQSKRELQHIPVLANVDFGHTDPIITFPIGGESEIVSSGEEKRIKIGNS